MSDELKLKPCPFCGGEAFAHMLGNEIAKGYYIACDECGAKTIVFGYEADAIEAWNRRAEPEQKNQKTALSVQVKADFDDMKDLLEDIGNLQTYKFFEGNDMVLVNIEDIKGILTKHVKAKEVQPERKKGEWIEYPDCLQYDGAYADDQIVCSECHHVFSILDNCTEEFDFCPHCGADMRGE